MNLNLNDRKWSSLFIGGNDGIFKITSTSSGIDKNKLIFGEKIIPYVTRTETNNGINLFIREKQQSKYKIDTENVIIIGLDTQTVFYQPYKFYTGQNIQILKNNNLNKYNSLFVIPLLKIQMQKFNWGGNGATLGRLNRTKIMLPISKEDENAPDWKFMEDYIKEQEVNKKNIYKVYINNVLKNIKYKYIVELKDKRWKEFNLDKYLFTVSIGKAIDGNKVDKFNGNNIYITRKEQNNGVDGFINYDIDYLCTHFPVITIGNETAEPYVQTYPFFTGTKVNILNPKVKLSKYTLYFISTCLKQQKSKYNYSFTINSTRLKKQNIMLPINDKNNPDYEYMEQYIKNLMVKKYNEYISCE